MPSAVSKQNFFNDTNNAFGAKREFPVKANRNYKRWSGQNYQYQTNKNFAKRNQNGHAPNPAHIFKESCGLNGRRYGTNQETGFKHPKPTFASTQSNAKRMFHEKYAQEKFIGKPFQNRKFFNTKKIDKRTRKGEDISSNSTNSELSITPRVTSSVSVDKCQEVISVSQCSGSYFESEMSSEMNQPDRILSNSKCVIPPSLMEYRKPSVDQENPEHKQLPIIMDFITDYTNERSSEFEKLMNELSDLSSVLNISEKIEIQHVLAMNSQKLEETEELFLRDQSKAVDAEICSENNASEEEETASLDSITEENKLQEEIEMMELIKFCWSPLNVCQMIEDQINADGGMHHDKKIFWKIVISMPAEGSILNCNQDRLTKWLARKFKMADEQLPEDGTDVCLCHSHRMTTINGRDCDKIDLCVRSTKDIPVDPMIMQGASSVIFFIRDQTESCNVKQFLDVESERLSAFLGNRHSLPAPSLTIVALRYPNCTADYISESLRLSSYVEKEQIGSFRVITCDDVWNKETSCQLKEAIQFTLQRLPSSPPLRTQTVAKFFEEYLSRFLSIPVENNFQRGYCDRVKVQELPFLIDAYNKVANWLISKLTDFNDLGSISWPPAEFCLNDKDLPSPLWNLKERFEALEIFLKERILLPSFPITSDRTWDEACQTLSEYLMNITDDSPSSRNMICNVNKTLEKAKSQVKPWKRPRFMKVSSQLSSSIVPRAAIATALINFKLSQLCDIKDLEFDRLLTVSYFEDLLTEEEVQTLVCPPPTTFETNAQCKDLNTTPSVTKEDVEVLFNEVSAEKAANDLFLRYLEDALGNEKEVLDVEPKFKKARLY